MREEDRSMMMAPREGWEVLQVGRKGAAGAQERGRAEPRTELAARACWAPLEPREVEVTLLLPPTG